MAKKIIQKTKLPMPLQDAHARASNFEEVSLGYPVDLAVLEAQRCIQCKNNPCIAGCPVEIDIPTFLLQVGNRDFEGAFKTLMDNNVLPAVCGRVCPQEDQCEAKCTLGVKNEPVAIGRVERFVADYAAIVKFTDDTPSAPSTGHRVAVVGSGPAGLTVAADLTKMGQVSPFEALHKPGRVLVRHPRIPVAEVDCRTRD